MDRRNVLLKGLNLQRQQGLEIGALDRPLVPKTEGRIFYVDFTDTETLRKNYEGHPYIRAENLVTVDGIWGANTLLAAAKDVAPVDYVAASHVIEHVPDLIGWLGELHAVVKSDGQIRLAIPDRRYTFDVHRAETRLADVLDAHIGGARAPLPREVLDYVLNATPFDMVHAWAGGRPSEERPWISQAERAIELAREVAQHGTYHDSHCWVFTPLSFASLMEQLAEIGLIELQCSWLIDTAPDQHEFFTALSPGRSAAEVVASWRDVRSVLARSARESSEAERLSRQLKAAEVEQEQLLQRLKDLDAQNRALKELVGALRNSNSWRVTAPLRYVAAMFGRGARP